MTCVRQRSKASYDGCVPKMDGVKALKVEKTGGRIEGATSQIGDMRRGVVTVNFPSSIMQSDQAACIIERAHCRTIEEPLQRV